MVLFGIVRSTLQVSSISELQRRFFKDIGGATFGVNNRPIYMALCSFLVLGGQLDTGSRPSVVND